MEQNDNESIPDCPGPDVVKLERVSNGVILTDQEGLMHVFEVKEGCDGNDKMDSIQLLLYHVMESLGYMNQKYDRENIEIKIVHGRGYECKGCDICKEEDTI